MNIDQQSTLFFLLVEQSFLLVESGVNIVDHSEFVQSMLSFLFLFFLNFTFKFVHEEDKNQRKICWDITTPPHLRLTVKED